jgi:hypothetical protein
MSQFYDLSSLVVIPSGYKASTIYAQKPLTTDGQLSFSRASTATRVNASGLIEAVASNVPRLDYLGSSCPRLLLEPQRTNLQTFSEQFDNAAWAKLGTTTPTITANATTSPDGTTNADLLTGTGGIGQRVQSTISVSLLTAYSVSIYVKANTSTTARLNIFDGITDRGGDITFSTGAVTTYGTGVNATSQNMGNGWYRFTINYTSFATISIDIQFGVSGSTSYYLWGAQVEAGAYATSYIPTLAASVTRVADNLEQGGISSLIGQGSGSLFVDFNLTQLDEFGGIVELNATSSGTTTRILLWKNTINQLQANFGGMGSVINAAATVGRHKVCITYSASFLKYFLDGVKIGQSVSNVSPTGFNVLSFVHTGGGVSLQKKEINQTLLFKTELTEAQALELTTL